jgi:hypothetical protein
MLDHTVATTLAEKLRNHTNMILVFESKVDELGYLAQAYIDLKLRHIALTRFYGIEINEKTLAPRD